MGIVVGPIKQLLMVNVHAKTISRRKTIKVVVSAKKSISLDGTSCVECGEH